MAAPRRRPRAPHAVASSAAPLAEPAAVPAAAGPPPVPTSAFLLGWSLLPALLLIALAVVALHPVLDPDIWFHMALGREVLEGRGIPRADLFSYNAAGNEWISSGWLASVLFEAAYRALSDWGLVLTVLVVAAAAQLLILLASARASEDGLPSLCVALQLLAATIGGSLRLTPRPEVFTLLLMPCLLVLLGFVGDRRDRDRWLWAAPALFALWANLHAGFLAGLVPVALFGAWRALRAVGDREPLPWRALLPLLACGAAWMLNSYGPRLLALAGKIKAMPGVERHILEWMPLLAASDPLPWPIYFGVFLAIAISAWGLARQGAKAPWWIWLAAVFFVAIALQQRRHAGLSCLSLAALLAFHHQGAEADLRRLPLVARWALPVALAAGIILLQMRGAFGTGRALLDVATPPETDLPVHAVRFLQANPPPARLLNSYGPGGYLLYHLGPETQVFIDGRLDVYDTQTWLDYNALESGAMPLPEARETYNLRSALIHLGGLGQRPNHLAMRFALDPQWRLTYFDDKYAFFLHQSDETADAIVTHGYTWISPFNTGLIPEGLATPGRREEVLREADRAVEASGGSGRAHLLAAIAYRHAGHPQQAAEHEARAKERNPGLSLAPAR